MNYYDSLADLSHRQHINLSNRAYDIIYSDLYIFSSKKLTLSGYINHVLEVFRDDSDASITKAVEKKRAYYSDIICSQRKKNSKKSELSKEEKTVVDSLVQDYFNELIQKNISYPKEKTLKIRLQNKVYNYFYPTMDEDNYDTPCQYIKAILEDFTSRPLIEREKYLFINAYTTLSLALQNENDSTRKLLLINYIHVYSGKKMSFLVKPYKLTTDPEIQFNYLIGLSKQNNKEADSYIPAVFRLSRIEDNIKTISYKSGKITKEEKKDLETKLSMKGVQFLTFDEQPTKILLTPDGYNKYNNISHLRPVSTKVEETSDNHFILTFNCTSMQINNYFFNFGKDATILEPEELAEAFHNEYLQAAQNYESLD